MQKYRLLDQDGWELGSYSTLDKAIEAASNRLDDPRETDRKNWHGRTTVASFSDGYNCVYVVEWKT